ncbi:hypothetical protein L873DRAFT_1786187 [Choiromyces venosus 120613-1]|uniref:DUF4139 domain-containing protein n=1 Tax=Choiromyces venosus 120613-1 TaxID=1336337 RepID=A0A3N4K151_9PEZI|nr:hypothetical protein L873DRAFT_1786187 [Choiromyces venosus 120613-1]
MAENTIHKQSFSVDDLSVRSVTIYPSRAAIVRDINNVTIKPGRNEITIYNLTPHAEADSIKVEGHNTRALITDMTVDLIPNARYDEHQFDDHSDSDTSSEEEEVSTELEKLEAQLKATKQELAEYREIEASCLQRQEYMNTFIKTWAEKATVAPSENVRKELNAYADIRQETFDKLVRAKDCTASTKTKLEKLEKAHEKIKKRWEKALRKKNAVKMERRRHKEFARKERKEQKLYTPERVFRVKITVELDSLLKETKSVPSAIDTGRPARPDDDLPPVNDGGPSLRISYIAGGASWIPRYDIRLDTTSNTGSISYRAHFYNKTGEIWRDAKITLSTSQTSFNGIEDKAPWMDAWRVSLRRRGYYGSEKDGGLYALPEQEKREKKKLAARRAKGELDTQYEGGQEYYGHSALEGVHRQTALTKSAGTGRVNKKVGFGLGGGLIRSRSLRKPAPSAAKNPYSSDSSGPSDDEDDDGSTMLDSPPNKMGIATSTSETHGLTTTYDLPGIRTVVSSKQLSRYIISEFSLPTVEFSHLAVPKYRAAVFLKARLRNPSPTTLLRGPAGLTIDGTFLGNSTVSRCAPNDTFEIGLGVDEEVTITYAKPARRIASEGMLMKEQVLTYERNMSIYNTRSTPITLILFDQVPVSEEERLRIVVKKPVVKNIGDTLTGPATNVRFFSGFEMGGKKPTSVPAGPGVKVELRKNGEVRWEIGMEKGAKAKVGLEYEARMPSGEVIHAEKGGD